MYSVKVDAFDFELPAELIAQEAVARGASRLLVLDRRTSSVAHASVRDLPDWLRSGDLLVAKSLQLFRRGRVVPVTVDNHQYRKLEVRSQKLDVRSWSQP